LNLERQSAREAEGRGDEAGVRRRERKNGRRA
jgi:hypothetical protein